MHELSVVLTKHEAKLFMFIWLGSARLGPHDSTRQVEMSNAALMPTIYVQSLAELPVAPIYLEFCKFIG